MLIVLYVPDRSKQADETEIVDDIQILSPVTNGTKLEKDISEDPQEPDANIGEETIPLIRLLPDVGHNDNHDDDAIDNPDADASPDLELDDKATIDRVAEPDPGNNENPEGLPEDGIQKNDVRIFR